jgi:PAS domain S-box-containing protein
MPSDERSTSSLGSVEMRSGQTDVRESAHKTVKWVFGFSGVLLLAIAGPACWILVLRNRLREQTESLKRRLENEAALERRYQDLVTNAKEVIFSLDLDYRITFINPTGQSVFGLPQAALVGMPLLHWIAPDHQETVQRWLSESAIQENSKTRQLVLVSPKGDRVYLEVSFCLSSGRGLPGALYVVGRDVTERLRMAAEREQLIHDLQQALKNVKTLSGLLPICANCKKVRDDSGYWSKIEKYICAHSQVQFTHGICPECAQILYPQLVGNRTLD